MVGSIPLTSNNFAPNGVFDATTTLAPYNVMTQNLRGVSLTGRKIGLQKLTITYSWPNVRSGMAITVAWPVGAGYVNFTWSTPAMFNYKSVAAMNQSLQDFCIDNGLYLINGSNNVYYLELVANEGSYKIDLNLYLVPTVPGTYTAPGTWPGYPAVAATPKLIIPTGSELCNLIGFSAGTYNGGGSAIQYSSTYVPQFSPVGSIFLTCNIAKNDVPINGSTVINTFTTVGTEYGGTIVVEPQSLIDFYEIDANSNNLELRFYDQDWNLLPVIDPRTTVSLLIR